MEHLKFYGKKSGREGEREKTICKMVFDQFSIGKAKKLGKLVLSKVPRYQNTLMR